MEAKEIILNIESKKGFPDIQMSLNKFIFTDEALSTFSDLELLRLRDRINNRLW